MVAATHGCPQATPDGPLHPVKRHDVTSVHPLAGRQPVMSRWPIRIRREHFAESIVDRCELSRSNDCPNSLGCGAESKIFTTGPLVIEVAAERMHLGPVGAWVDLPRPADKNIMACVQT